LESDNLNYICCIIFLVAGAWASPLQGSPDSNGLTATVGYNSGFPTWGDYVGLTHPSYTATLGYWVRDDLKFDLRLLRGRDTLLSGSRETRWAGLNIHYLFQNRAVTGPFVRFGVGAGSMVKKDVFVYTKELFDDNDAAMDTSTKYLGANVAFGIQSRRIGPVYLVWDIIGYIQPGYKISQTSSATENADPDSVDHQKNVKSSSNAWFAFLTNIEIGYDF